jgi:signal transduction histidine kinase/DNA-binding response OmpR family regulator
MSKINSSQIRHELRTPINHIIGYSEMLQEEAQEQGCEDLIPEFQKIRDEGQQLLTLVNEGLDLDSPGTGPTQIWRLSQELRHPVSQVIRHANATQQIAEDRGLGQVVSDLQKISTAAGNLLNATTGDAPNSSVKSGRKSIRPEKDVTPSSIPPVEGIFGRPGGASTHDRQDGKGSLLVVEDNETSRRMLCRRLKRQGYQVAEAENGRQAMEMVRAKAYDLILLDLMMPDVNGYQVLEQLKSDGTLRHIPVIMLSAREEVDSVARCIETGAEDYLAKPFNPVQLKARIDASLEKKRLRDQEFLHLQQIESINAELEKRVEERVKELRKSNKQLVIEIAERKRLEEQLQNKISEMAVVDEIASIVTSTLDIDQVYENFTLAMRKLLVFDRISVNVIEYDTYAFRRKYLFGQDAPGRLPGGSIPLLGTQTEYVMRTHQTVIRHDIADARTFHIDQFLVDSGLHGSIMVPLISKDRVIGSMSLQSRKIGTYGEREQIILERLAKQIAPAIENAQLYDETIKEKERTTNALVQLRALLNSVDAGILLVGNNDETVLWANQRFDEFFGISKPQFLVGRTGLGPRLREIPQTSLTNLDEILEGMDRITADRDYFGTEELQFIGPVRRTIRRFTTPVYDDHGEYLGRLWVHYDVTEQRKLEEQFLQAQKMESVGRLAGGIAHDFNNLLTPIMGYATLGSMYLSPEHPTHGHLEEVKKAAERASNLTHQLLAFSRGQVIEPKVISLNDLVLKMNELLSRLIGEDIELVTLPAADLDLVKVDPGQLGQVLLNLVVNARDAMPQGGKLFIKTSNVWLDEEYRSDHPDAHVGPQVMLSVCDTGVGIPESVKAHLFEPFFTTKERGKGTGLGLATCYGIVRQSGGYIEVESEVGKGTCFKIYLPKTDEAADPTSRTIEETRLPRGTETVLLAEDEPSVRGMIATILQNQGYTVLQAANGDEAMRVAKEHSNTDIDLLLTDVVMPKMGGIELASRFRMDHPATKVILTSGYSDQPMLPQDLSGPGVDFIQKPFLPVALATKVRDVLDSKQGNH